jgi:hypothetical protein
MSSTTAVEELATELQSAIAAVQAGKDSDEASDKLDEAKEIVIV